MSATAKSRTARRFCRFVLVAVFVAVAATIAIDGRLKSGDVPIHPPAAAWYAYSVDAPGFAAAATGHPQSAPAWAEVSGLGHEASVAFRIAMGIRPTPARWRRWFGREMIAWGDGSDWAFCARPGILARAAGVLRSEAAADGSRRIGDAYYAWHDSCLVVSTSSAYLAASLEALGTAPELTDRSGSLNLWWQAPGAPAPEAPAAFRVYIPKGPEGLWAFTGTLPVSVAPSVPVAAPAWGQEPLIEIAGGSVRDWGRLFSATPLRHARRLFPPQLDAAWQDARARWALPPEVFDYVLDSPDSAAALLDIDARATLPVPRFALAFPLGEAAPPFPPADERLPHTWNGVEGYLWPFLGQAYLFAAAPRHGRYFVTSQEPAMASLLEAQPGELGPGTDGWTLEADFHGLAQRLTQILGYNASLDLLPASNANDFDRFMRPVLQAAGAMGTLRVEVKEGGGGVAFAGGFTPKEVGE